MGAWAQSATATTEKHSDYKEYMERKHDDLNACILAYSLVLTTVNFRLFLQIDRVCLYPYSFLGHGHDLVQIGKFWWGFNAATNLPNKFLTIRY